MSQDDQPQPRMHHVLRLRGRFILTISAILIAVFSVIAFFSLRSTRSSLTNDLNKGTQIFAALAAKPIGDAYGLYSQSGTVLITQQMQKFAQLDSNISNVAVVNLEGLSQFSLNGTPINISTQDVTSFNTRYQYNSRGQITSAVVPYISDNGQHSYSIAYEVSPAQVNKSIAQQERFVGLVTLLGLLTSALAAYEFINFFFINPLNKLNTMAQLVAAGDYGKKVGTRRQDEIGALSRSIDLMADNLSSDIIRLQELDKQKNEFIMIASHNLRTPLTIIQGNISLLQESMLDEKIKPMVRAMKESANELYMFSEEMLTIASLESATEKKPVAHVITAKELLDPLISEFEQRAKVDGKFFNVVVNQPEAKINANRHQLAGALHSLLDNAMKFSPQNGRVDMISGVTGNKLIISVRDNGIGIKKEEMPKLFTKFHRGNELLVYNYKGTGIGLYTAKLIVEWHHGLIHAESIEGSGSTFTVELPIATAEGETSSSNT